MQRQTGKSSTGAETTGTGGTGGTGGAGGAGGGASGASGASGGRLSHQEFLQSLSAAEAPEGPEGVDSRPLASNAERGSAAKNIYDDDAFAAPLEELLSIVGAAGAATNDVPGVSANLEAAEMAQIFVRRMHRPCNVRVVLAHDVLRRSAVELLLTRNPMVFEYVVEESFKIFSVATHMYTEN